MKHGRIGDENAMREAPQIRTLISDLDRIVQILNCDIASEEERVRVFDRSDVTPAAAPAATDGISSRTAALP